MTHHYMAQVLTLAGAAEGWSIFKPNETTKSSVTRASVVGTGVDVLSPGHCLETSVLLIPPETAPDGKTPFQFVDDCSRFNSKDAFELGLHFSEAPVHHAAAPADADVAKGASGGYTAFSGSVKIGTRCRDRGQSFLFTFRDADGSVQQAGVV